MTASQQPAKGVEAGRKRLITYGKTSRKRIHTASPSRDATHPHEATDDHRLLEGGEKSPPALALQRKSAPFPPITSGNAQNGIVPMRNLPQPDETSQREVETKGHPALMPDTISSSLEPTVSKPTLTLPQEPTSTFREDVGSNVSFTHRQKRPADVDFASSGFPAVSTGTPESSTDRPDNGAHLPADDKNSRAFSTPKPRRPRLIDTLSAQRMASPEPELKRSDSNLEFSQSDYSYTPNSQRGAGDRDARLRQDHRSRDTPKRRKVKYTYSQSRSFLSDSQSSRGMATGESDPLLESLLSETSKPPTPSAFDFPQDPDDDDDDDESSKTAIKSVHELRRAGAHNRFADEMEDLLFRIGTPNCDGLSMRRNALLELASKLDGADFTNQFRNHAARDNIVRSIGDEEDLICAFALAASLVIFLAAGPAPNLLRQLAEDHVGRFLGRMLRAPDDIESIASQRTANLSRSSRATVRNVKILLMRMRVWHGYSISNLSPRNLGLQLLEMFFRVSEPRHLELVADELEPDLALLAAHYSQSTIEDDVGVALIVSIFEAQSSATSLLNEKPTKVRQLMPLVIKLLPGALQRWSETGGELESNTLKLAINITNTESGAAAFDGNPILGELTNCVQKGLLSMQNVAGEPRVPKETYDRLLLILGIMINIMEHCTNARRSMNTTSVETLASVYMTSRSNVTEEKSQLTVPFGYLSVLLGYLSLAGPVRAQIGAQIKAEGARHLIETIQQLISMYNNSGNDARELESLVNELRIRYRY